MVAVVVVVAAAVVVEIVSLEKTGQNRERQQGQ